MTASEIARLASVGRAAVGNWRKRHADFPVPAGGSETSPTFRRADVEAWLRANGKLDDRLDAERLWQRLDAFRWGGRTAAVLAGLGLVLLRGSAEADLRSWAEEHHPELAPALDDGVERDALELAPDALTVAAHDESPALFEDLCRRFLDARSGQVHATPPELADLMVALAGLRDGDTVVDPACGTGGLLLAALAAGAASVSGQEIEPAAAMLTRVRLTVAGAAPTIAVGDTLKHDALDGSVDVVVTNPPFALRDWQGDDAFADPRWRLGLPPRGESELAWVQHCLAHLDVDGEAVVLMPPGAATRASGRRIRAELVRQGLLRGVVALPPGSLPESGIAPSVWLLRHDPQADPDDGVIMVDASAHVRGRRVEWTAFRRAVQAALVDPEAADPSVVRRVPAIELLDDEVSLLPARHLRPAAPVASDVASTRDRLLTLLDRARASVPTVQESSPSPTARWTTLKELAVGGAVTLLSSPSRIEVDDGADGPLVLTGRDVATGRPPTARLVETLADRVVVLERGDVVLPTIATRPVARVIDEEDVVLGANLLAVRARPDAFDPWYLAGVLQGDHVLRAGSTAGSGAFRLTPRHVEVRVVPLAEQRPLAEGFRMLAQLESTVALVAELGVDVAGALRSGLVDGSLAPADDRLTTAPTGSSAAATHEGEA